MTEKAPAILDCDSKARSEREALMPLLRPTARAQPAPCAMLLVTTGIPPGIQIPSAPIVGSGIRVVEAYEAGHFLQQQPYQQPHLQLYQRRHQRQSQRQPWDWCESAMLRTLNAGLQQRLQAAEKAVKAQQEHMQVLHREMVNLMEQQQLAFLLEFRPGLEALENSAAELFSRINGDKGPSDATEWPGIFLRSSALHLLELVKDHAARVTLRLSSTTTPTEAFSTAAPAALRVASPSGEDLAARATVRRSSTAPETAVTAASQAVKKAAAAAAAALQLLQLHQKLHQNLQLQPQLASPLPPSGEARVEVPMLGQVELEPTERVAGPQHAEIETCIETSGVASLRQSRPFFDDAGIPTDMQGIAQSFGATGTTQATEDYDTRVLEEQQSSHPTPAWTFRSRADCIVIVPEAPAFETGSVPNSEAWQQLSGSFQPKPRSRERGCAASVARSASFPRRPNFRCCSGSQVLTLGDCVHKEPLARSTTPKWSRQRSCPAQKASSLMARRGKRANRQALKIEQTFSADGASSGAHASAASLH